MAGWLSYSLSDFLLFAPRTYYRLFELYNLDLWPAQIAAAALGAGVIVATARPRPWVDRAVPAILAALWLWIAWAFLLERYATINWAAVYLATGFLGQGVLLGVGAGAGWIGFERISSTRGRIGLAIAIYALVVHPLVPIAMGRPWQQAEVFGLAPDPTAIGTLGLLVLARPAPWIAFVLPVLWCAISGLTLWAMKSPEALLPPFLALAAVAAAWRR
jgi:hypothetical protein